MVDAAEEERAVKRLKSHENDALAKPGANDSSSWNGQMTSAVDNQQELPSSSKLQNDVTNMENVASTSSGFIVR